MMFLNNAHVRNANKEINQFQKYNILYNNTPTLYGDIVF